jgi:hypothetical protein
MLFINPEYGGQMYSAFLVFDWPYQVYMKSNKILASILQMKFNNFYHCFMQTSKLYKQNENFT